MEWKSAITKIEPNKITVRGYPVDQLMGKTSFAQVIYLLLMGELPARNVSEIIDAVLVSSVDHGTNPPSCLAARNITSGGAPLNAAVAGGILAISKAHGGSVEACLVTIEECLEKIRTEGLTRDRAASEIVEEYRKNRRPISGFGHKIHTRDPRTGRLLEMARERKLSGEHIDALLAIGEAIEKSLGRKLPLNVTGAIAAVLGGIGFSPPVANAFFLMARVPGLIAHVCEETERYKPLRTIDPSGATYDGPAERSLEEEDYGGEKGGTGGVP